MEEISEEMRLSLHQLIEHKKGERNLFSIHTNSKPLPQQLAEILGSWSS